MHPTRKIITLVSTLVLLVSLGSCRTPIPVATTYEVVNQPTAPDYIDNRYWAALPSVRDMADLTPEGLTDQQATAIADVFYIHPTIYSKTRKGNDAWNADLNDEKLNESVDESAIKNQASIFNAAGRVFAPRYRQAHLNVFRQRGTEVAEGALDLAYADVLAAFDHYLEKDNNGRPIIIAAHSQGTVHAARLLADRFVGKPLKRQLIVAYLIGMPVPAAQFTDISVCQDSTETGCFVSWRTYRKDYVPKQPEKSANLAVVNPLNWSTEKDIIVPATENEGGVLYNFDKVLPELVDAEIRGNLLYVSKPNFFGDIFFTRKNYHIGDLNLFWVNIRENAVTRTKRFSEQ